MSILTTVFYLFAWIVLIYEFQSLLYSHRIISVFDRQKLHSDSISLKKQYGEAEITMKDAFKKDMQQSVSIHFTGYEKTIIAIYFFYSI